jgi:rhamnogalacturonan endolyase
MPFIPSRRFRGSLRVIPAIASVLLTLADPAAVSAAPPTAAVRADATSNRALVVLRRKKGTAYIGWRSYKADPPDLGFHVYRISGKKTERLTRTPIVRSSNFNDEASPSGKVSYFIQPVTARGEGPTTPAVEAVAAEEGDPIKVIPLQGQVSARDVGVTDLDGDGRFDFLVRHPAANLDPYTWKRSKEPYKIDAYSSDGRFLWRHELGWAIETGIWYSPVLPYDIDGDGKAEVFAKVGEGDPREPGGQVIKGPEFLARIDGLTGKIVKKVPWPDRSGYDNYNHTSRNILGIAYLDGKRPHVIVIRGTYTIMKVRAFDPDLNLVWSWESSGAWDGQGMHGMHAADVDGDGRDEVILGASVLTPDGKPLWNLGKGHPDVVHVGDLDPSRPGLEIFYGFEKPQALNGMCLVEAKTGKIIWGHGQKTTHIHGQGMAADLLPEYPGAELFGGEKSDPKARFLYTVTGQLIPAPAFSKGVSVSTLYWDGDAQKDLLNETKIALPVDDHGEEGTHVQYVGDILGDWREEAIVVSQGALRVYTTPLYGYSRRPWLMEDRLYRMETARTMSGYTNLPQLGEPLFKVPPPAPTEGASATRTPPR